MSNPFILPNFRPLPLLGNPHVQTLLGNLALNSVGPLPSELHVVDLPDGDRLAVHDTRPANWHSRRPAVLLLHGLGGCHQSPSIVRTTCVLAPRGVRVLRVDLRGTGAGLALARKRYNAACSQDVRAVANWYHAHNPGSPLAIVGMSLGGSIALKLAGEAAEQPVPGLALVAAVSAPLDLVRCAALLATYPIYDRWYVHHMVKQTRAHQRLFPDRPVRFPRKLTLHEYDDIYTAPRSGFDGAVDYYRKASSLPLLSRVQLPVLLMTARDDPFIAPEDYAELKAPPNMEVWLAPRGGHLGFVGWDGTGGVRWGERQVVEWVCRKLGV